MRHGRVERMRIASSVSGSTFRCEKMKRSTTNKSDFYSRRADDRAMANVLCEMKKRFILRSCFVPYVRGIADSRAPDWIETEAKHNVVNIRFGGKCRIPNARNRAIEDTQSIDAWVIVRHKTLCNRNTGINCSLYSNRRIHIIVIGITSIWINSIWCVSTSPTILPNHSNLLSMNKIIAYRRSRRQRYHRDTWRWGIKIIAAASWIRAPFDSKIGHQLE